MRRILSFIILSAFCSAAMAQMAYVADVNSLVPLENPKPDKPLKIVVNLNLTSNKWGIIELAKTNDMYIWTWSPYEFPMGSPKANGESDPAWKNSNPALKMTKEADGIYSFVMTPTEFYEVNAQMVYDRDIKLLVKPRDGGGYGAPDQKTEDLLIEFDPPVTIVKLASFPEGVGKNKDTLLFGDGDPFSIIYDHKVEKKASLDSAKEFYLFPKCKGSDGIEYKLAVNAKVVANYPELKMDRSSNDVFTGTIIPEKLFPLPAGVKVAEMTIQVVRPNLVNSDDSVDEILKYIYKDSTCD